MIAKRQIARDEGRLWRRGGVTGAPAGAGVRRIAQALLATPRPGGLAVLAAFVRLLRRDDTRRSAEVASAAPLDAATRAAVTAGLERRYARPMDVTFTVDPALIGGLRIVAWSDVFDDSVRARLAALEQQS